MCGLFELANPDEETTNWRAVCGKIGWCLTLTYKAVLGMKSILKLSTRDLQAMQTWRVCDFFIAHHHF